MGEFRDFGLDMEHEQFRAQFRRFVQDRLVPLAEVAEAEHRFPREIYGMLGEQGYLAVNLPNHWAVVGIC